MAFNYGNIEGLRDETHFLWHIPDYFSCQTADFYYASPDFHFLGITFNIRIYPNGQRMRNTVGYVGLHVLPHIIDIDYDISFSVSIVSEGDNLEGNCHVKPNPNHYPVLTELIERRILINNRIKYVPGDILTIKVIGKRGTVLHTESERKMTVLHTESERKMLDGVASLTHDFQTLLSTEEASDVTIIVKSHVLCRVFRAHRLILMTRSTVFAAMFKLLRKDTVTINIEDCEPFAFQEFLTFMYTGKIDNLSSKNVSHIIFIANKYDVNDLKQICIAFMEENLCLDTVCNVLFVADKFDLVDLQKSARDFVLRNNISVINNKNWIPFLRENPELAAGILLDVLHALIQYEERRLNCS